MTDPDPIDYPATQFQDAGDEYVAWTPPPAEGARAADPWRASQSTQTTPGGALDASGLGCLT